MLALFATLQGVDLSMYRLQALRPLEYMNLKKLMVEQSIAATMR